MGSSLLQAWTSWVGVHYPACHQRDVLGHLVSFSVLNEQRNDSLRAKIYTSQSGGHQDKSGAFQSKD